MQPQLPAGLRTRIEEYVTVEAEDEPERSRSPFSPDVREIERPGASDDSGGFLRAGRWVLAVPLGFVPRDYREPYRICVVR